MITQMSQRPYRKKRRAEQQAQTRDRIVEATMALHEELGPRGATVSAIAERAGVQRLTVYRHFPDDTTLFAACTGRWLEENPPPAPEEWAGIGEPGKRVQTALKALYAYYRRTARMWAVSYRDRNDVAALHEPMAAFEAHLDAVRDDLRDAFAARGSTKRLLSATLEHAVQFSTWASLHAAGLGDTAMAGLVVRWLEGIGAGGARNGRKAEC